MLYLCKYRSEALLFGREEAFRYHSAAEENAFTNFSLFRLLLGYVSAHNRMYLMDKNMAMISYELEYALLQYQQLIIEKNFAEAEKVFPSIRKDNHLKVAKFLEMNENKELAYMITPDTIHK